MTALERFNPEDRPKEGEIVASRIPVEYRPTPDTRLPDKPRTEIRYTSGWFGGPDRQDVANDRRLRELYHLGTEVAYAEQMAVGVEVHGIKATAEAMSKTEEIVYGLQPDSVAAMVASDQAGEMAARSRIRHGRLAEAYDAEAMNIIRNR